MNAGETRQETTTALADLVDRHYASLFAYLYFLTGDRALAEDLAQETFLRAHEAGRLPARPDAQGPWLYRLASGLAQAAAASGGSTAALGWSDGQPAGGAPGLPQILAALPRPQAALLLLYGRAGLSLAEAAAVLHISGRTAADWLSRAAAECHRRREPPAQGEIHEAIWPALARYRELRPAARAAVDAHVTTCPGCASRLGAYSRIERDLVRLPEPWPMPHSRSSLAAAIRHGDIAGLRRSATQQPAPAPRRLLPLAAGLLVVMAVAVWVAVGGRLGPTAGRAVAPAAVAEATLPPPPTPLPSPTPLAPSVGSDLPPPAALAWLQGHTFPLTTTEPSGWYGDLLPLRGLLGRAQVVALDDDGGFGSHEAQAFRQRLLEILVGELGFETLLVPLDWAGGDLLNQYIQGADVDPLDLLSTSRSSAGPAGGLWQSQETLYSLRWLRAHNAQAGAQPKVTVRGFLPLTEPSSVPLDVILGYLEDVDPATVDRIGKQFANNHRALLLFLQAREGQYMQRSSPGLYRRAVAAAQALLQYDTMQSATSAGQRALLFDAAAMLNLMNEWTDLGPEGKEIVWTPGLASPGLASVNNLLQAERRGGAVLTVGLAFDQGTVYATGPAADAATDSQGQDAGAGASSAGLRSFTLPAAPPGSYEDFLAQASRPNFFLDLRSAFGQAADTAWLRGPHLARSPAGNDANCGPAAYEPIRLNRTYDIIVYFRQVTPPNLLAQPAPAKAAPAPACAPAP